LEHKKEENKMRFVSDQNSICLIGESGTYAATSGAGQWIGLVNDHTATVSENVTQLRFVGNASRDVGMHVRGAEDYEGTISYNPQNWQMLNFVMGSCVDAGSPSPYSHVLSAVDSNVGNAFTSGTILPFISFSIEDSQGGMAAGNNAVKTFNGCVANEFTLTSSQGELAEVSLSYMAQDVVYTSGTKTAVTASTLRPFLWEDFKIHLPSGTVLNNVLSMEFSIKNNTERRHYLNGSRVADVPVNLNREYQLTLTTNADNADFKTQFTSYLQSGTEFNMMLEQNCIDAGAGSRNAYFVLSGCKLTSMEMPLTNEGVNEQTLTIIPKTCSVTIADGVEKYNYW
jgi:hypothetical protein